VKRKLMQYRLLTKELVLSRLARDFDVQVAPFVLHTIVALESLAILRKTCQYIGMYLKPKCVQLKDVQGALVLGGGVMLTISDG
jgi:hypothetical protein